jgi:hypothetical protein
MNDDALPKPLRPHASDHAALFLRATLGNFPVGGALLAEMINVVIPNQREERFANYVAKIARRLERAERRIEDFWMAMGPEQTALFEEGARGAVHSTTADRIDQLVQLVTVGLVGSDRVADDQRSIVRLLNDLSEADIRYLMQWTRRYGRNEGWRKANGCYSRWERQEDGTFTHFGDSMDSLVELSTQARLVALGLFEQKVVPRGTVTDRDGDGYELDTEISAEGFDLLRRLGLLGPEEE